MIGERALVPIGESAEVAPLSATEVGAAYLSARSTPQDPLVVSAYAHLQAETDRLFDAAVRSDGPNAVRIVFTRCPDPYASDRELIAAVRTTRVLEVTTAAVSSEPLHPLLGCEYGGPFDRFRAIHDLIGHAATGFGFELPDEIAAWRTQDRLHGRLARSALATEILAINCTRSVLGEAPEHKATLLEPRLLQRWRRSSPVRASPSLRSFRQFDASNVMRRSLPVSEW